MLACLRGRSTPFPILPLLPLKLWELKAWAPEYSNTPLPGLCVRARGITCTRFGTWEVGRNHRPAPLAGVGEQVYGVSRRGSLQRPTLSVRMNQQRGCCGWLPASLLPPGCWEGLQEACQPATAFPDCYSFSPLNCSVSIEYPGLNSFLPKIPGKVFLFFWPVGNAWLRTLYFF